MKLLNRFDVSRGEGGGPRKFSFEMTMSGIVSLAVVAILGLCWVFILGILVGRGYKPENAVPELAQIMPTTETPAGPEKAQEPPTVLRPEELQFMDDLRAKGKEGVYPPVVVDSTKKPVGGALEGRDIPATSTPRPQGQAIPPAPTSQAGPQAQGTKPAATPAAQPPAATQAPQTARTPPAPTPTQPAQAAKLAEKAPDPKAAKPSPEAVKPAPEEKPADKTAGPRYEASYQLASFNKRDQAETMLKKLSQKGIQATLQEAKVKDRDVYRILARFRGTDKEISESLEKTGEKGPILLGRKPL